MKQLLIFAYLFGVFCGNVNAQVKNNKPVIDISDFQWGSLTKPIISSRGNYLAYGLSKRNKSESSMVIKSTDGSWEAHYLGAGSSSPCYFSGDEKQAVFLKQDTLFFIQLGASQTPNR